MPDRKGLEHLARVGGSALGVCDTMIHVNPTTGGGKAYRPVHRTVWPSLVAPELPERAREYPCDCNSAPVDSRG